MINTDRMKAEMAYYMKRLYEKGLTTCSGGNISFRISSNHFLVTPSGKDKGRLEAVDICECDAGGKSCCGNPRLSMETGMHMALYKKRPDINCIVHAHPPFVTSFAVSGQLPDTSLSGEMRALLGEPVLARYACMGSRELSENVAGVSGTSHVVILENHGALTMGKDLFQAYDRMEVLEAAAKLSFITGLSGKAKPLTAEQLNEIDDFFRNYSQST
jgi:L-fuculose-phosphate aldolase